MVASSGTWGKGQNVTFLLLQLIKKDNFNVVMVTWIMYMFLVLFLSC